MPALSSLAEVTLWTDQREWDQSLKKQMEVRTFRLGRMPWVELNRADANIYHIGNNPLFHSSIWQISRQHAGIVALHDFRLHHFFDDIFRVKWRDLHSYCAVMENYYGEQGRRDATESFNSNARNITYMAEQYPLTELAVKNQLGVVVHTQEAYNALSPEAQCPIMMAPLPFAAGPAAPRTQGASGEQNGPPYRLIVFGYIGRSRRLSSVLKAMAALPDPAQFHLDVYGDVLDGEDQLRAQIRALNLKERVTVHGFAPEPKLDEALSRAHLAINLRHPTMGEASGSQLRIWKHALPAMVSQVGWYASLPPEAVVFVRADDNEVADITSHLRALLSDPPSFVAMGRRGRVELEQKHAPERYASSLVAMAGLVQDFRARVAANRLAERAGTLLGEWLGAAVIGEAGANIAKEIFELGIIENRVQ
ncbi:MAG: hypothetical protein JWM21_1283 [Acidobacteria bacterium]|nr:hypothetical protein [Acidobacteriota bacterium]